jgi:hypothetical protein
MQSEELLVKINQTIALTLILMSVFSVVACGIDTNRSQVMNGSEFSDYINNLSEGSTFQGFICRPFIYNDSNSSEYRINRNHSQGNNFSRNNSFLSNGSLIEGNWNFDFDVDSLINSNIDEIEAGNNSPFLNMNDEKSPALKPESSSQGTRPYTEMKIQIVNGPSTPDENGNRVFPDDAEASTATLKIFYEADFPLMGEMTYPGVTVAPYEYVSCFQHFCTGRNLVIPEH